MEPKKKLGRPTDNPKDIVLKIRLDQGTAQKLVDAAQTLGVSKAEIVRRSVQKFHAELEEK